MRGVPNIIRLQITFPFKEEKEKTLPDTHGTSDSLFLTSIMYSFWGDSIEVTPGLTSIMYSFWGNSIEVTFINQRPPKYKYSYFHDPDTKFLFCPKTWNLMFLWEFDTSSECLVQWISPELSSVASVDMAATSLQYVNIEQSEVCLSEMIKKHWTLCNMT